MLSDVGNISSRYKFSFASSANTVSPTTSNATKPWLTREFICCLLSQEETSGSYVTRQLHNSYTAVTRQLHDSCELF